MSLTVILVQHEYSTLTLIKDIYKNQSLEASWNIKKFKELNLRRAQTFLIKVSSINSRRRRGRKTKVVAR